MKVWEYRGFAPPILAKKFLLNNIKNKKANMGFWKDVAYDMQRGMSKEKAIQYNYDLRYNKITEKERNKIIAKNEAELKINTLK